MKNLLKDGGGGDTQSPFHTAAPVLQQQGRGLKKDSEERGSYAVGCEQCKGGGTGDSWHWFPLPPSTVSQSTKDKRPKAQGEGHLEREKDVGNAMATVGDEKTVHAC